VTLYLPGGTSIDHSAFSHETSGFSFLHQVDFLSGGNKITSALRGSSFAFLDLAFLVTSLDHPKLRFPLGPYGLPVSAI